MTKYGTKGRPKRQWCGSALIVCGSGSLTIKNESDNGSIKGGLKQTGRNQYRAETALLLSSGIVWPNTGFGRAVLARLLSVSFRAVLGTFSFNVGVKKGRGIWKKGKFCRNSNTLIKLLYKLTQNQIKCQKFPALLLRYYLMNNVNVPGLPRAGNKRDM